MFRFARLTYKLLDPDGGQGGAEDTSGSGTDQGGSGSSTGDQTQDSGTKTFTQDEVNTIGAREKSQGKNSILKIFGCADEKTAKAEAEEFKKWKESQKVFEEMKKESRYSGFFGTGSSLGGTGSSADHNRGGQGTDNIGKRLAENKVKSTSVKSSFFSKS